MTSSLSAFALALCAPPRARPSASRPPGLPARVPRGGGGGRRVAAVSWTCAAAGGASGRGGGPRSASPSRGRGRGRGRDAPRGRGASRGRERARDPPPRDASRGRSEPRDVPPRGAPRGEEGAWKHASASRTRAWQRSTAAPLAPGESFRVVDVAKGPGRRGRPRGAPRPVFSDASSSSPPASPPASGGVRVNKCFKDFTSRREADRLVDEGRVTVNGVRAEAGARVFPGDVVALDGRPVRWETLAVIDDDVAAEAQFRYVKYWKPRGVTCTTDRRDRTNIIDAVGHPERIFPVGRLDKDSTGLILLTSDGRLPNAVLRSGRRHDKRYVVTVDRDVRAEDARTLAEGVVISTPVQRDRVDRVLTARTLPCEVRRVAPRTVEIVLREGRNRQIRRMLDAVGYRVVDLHRVEIMGIGLGGLRPGEWLPCDAAEMDVIRECLDAPDRNDSETGDDDDDEDA